MAKRFSRDELLTIKQRFEDTLFNRETFYLLVDKAGAARRALLNVLTLAGVDRDAILEAKEGNEAIVLADEKENPFVILTELTLPDMSACDMLSEICSRPGHENDKVVIVTAETRKPRLLEAVQAGHKSFIKKPFDPKSVAGQLKTMGVL